MEPIDLASRRLTPELKELKKELELAVEYGEDLFTDFEQELASSLLSQLNRKGLTFELSEKQKEPWTKMRKKLKKEGLLD